MIEINQARKVFGRRVAVEGLDLRVERGVIFGLLGPNGAGKSTTIGMLLGQVWPTSGTLRVRGCDVFNDRNGALSRVGAIFESPAFYDYLTGWRNLEILTAYTGPTPKARLREVLDVVGLGGREHDRVRGYSHGMRARLALAQALLPAPELLILDECTNGLAPEGIHEMRHTIRRLHAEMGLTILLSSHLLSEVRQLCTHIAVLRLGQKVYDGPIDEALRNRRRARLVTSDFDAAIRELTAVGLAVGSDSGAFVHLADNAATADVVRRLVGLGLPVHEITMPEASLEDFYLSLIQGGKADVKN
jgi:ABC-2 type transport system ATP-binding protein